MTPILDLCQRILALNPTAGEIGEGMLRDLQERAQRIAHQPVASACDGTGWYIIEVTDEGRFLRHWARYNLREAAMAEAIRLFPAETCITMWWRASDRTWHDVAG